ncbi:kinase-like domain-containing protein [Kalaharituber pfeilii]|nr:kinase-like domain-containing protein [Kalaharituber pfeilii]
MISPSQLHRVSFLNLPKQTRSRIAHLLHLSPLSPLSPLSLFSALSLFSPLSPFSPISPLWLRRNLQAFITGSNRTQNRDLQLLRSLAGQAITKDMDWIYRSTVPAEDVQNYKPGGFHPLLLGARLQNDRYEILHKLGFGAFGTVWLAKDIVNNRNVSIKIVVADQSEEHSSRELRILRHLSCSTLSHAGKRYIPTLIDSFYLDGPNGRHLCLVMDVVGPIASFVGERCKGERLTAKLTRMVSRQLMLAVDYLHECGVAHGDIHVGNVLFRYPGLDTLAGDRIEDMLGEPMTGLVTRIDGAPCGPNTPEYLVMATGYKKLNPFPDFNEIQLIDFGGAFFINEPPQSLDNPLPLKSPEQIFQHSLTQAVDIWSLGNTIFELAMGRPLFMVMFDIEFPQLFAKVLGDVPEGWVHEAIEKGVFTDHQIHQYDECLEGWRTLEDEMEYVYQKFSGEYDGGSGEWFSSKDISDLAKCLRRMLVVDPAKRATSQELIGEEWFNAGGTVDSEKDVGLGLGK